jgi:N-acetylglucosaminyl-diphospho-decaprenol L-rhamnosyltransferase
VRLDNKYVNSDNLWHEHNVIYFITVNYHSTELISQLISSLPSNNQLPYQVLIVNNSSEDITINQLKSDSVAIVESPTNSGFGSACNLGLNWIYSQDPHGTVWLINPDAYLLDDSIGKIISFCKEHPNISIIGTVIYTENDDIWFAGGSFIPRTGDIISKQYLNISPDIKYIESEWVSGCSLIINLGNFQSCPQFDPIYFLYYEDFDFCMRYAKQGHLVVVAHQIGVVHQPSSITNKNIFNKLQYSTYSYLLTLQKYSNSLVLLSRIFRVFLHAIVLLPIKPKMAFGKIYGALLYLKSRI